jgi:hypothetical protein
VFRNGEEIGRAAVDIADPDRPLGFGIYTLLDGETSEPSPYLPGRPGRRWMRVDLSPDDPGPDRRDLAERIRLPQAFAVRVYDVLEPGTTLLVTDEPAGNDTRTEPGFTVLAGVPEQAPEGAPAEAAAPGAQG